MKTFLCSARREAAACQATAVSIRTVVVNDSEELLDQISLCLLNQPDIDVAAVAHDGYEALEDVGVLRPQVVVLALKLPRMNGLETTVQLRRVFPDLCIIMTSADDGAEIAGLCREYGADGFVSKRRLGRDLCPTIRRAFAEHAA